MITSLAPALGLAQARATRAAAAAPAAPTRTLSDLPEVLSHLQSGEESQMVGAIDDLVLIGAPQCVPPLAEFLLSGQADALTDKALTALGQIADASAIETLAVFTHHRRVAARRRAIRALVQIGGDQVRGFLEAALGDSDRGIRSAAALGLGEIGASESIDLLFLAFDRGVTDAAVAIGKVGDEAALTRYNESLGRVRLSVMLSGYQHFLRRSEISIDAKSHVVEQLGEISGMTVRRFLQSYLETFPARITRQQSALNALKSLVQTTIRRIPIETSSEGAAS